MCNHVFEYKLKGGEEETKTYQRIIIISCFPWEKILIGWMGFNFMFAYSQHFFDDMHAPCFQIQVERGKGKTKTYRKIIVSHFPWKEFLLGCMGFNFLFAYS
jgi:hypothetical protein